MKKLSIVTSLLLSTTFVLANTNEQVITSKIKNVTVYLSGAQIKRTGKITYKKGVNYIRFEGVSPLLNPKTIQVKGSGNYTVLDVKKQVRYPNPIKKDVIEVPKKIKLAISKLTDSISKQNYLIQDVKNKLGFLRIEKDYLLKNKVFTKDSLAILDQSLNFLRKKLFDINTNQIKFQQQQELFRKQLSAMNTRLRNLNNYEQNNKPKPASTAPIHYIEVSVQALQTGVGKMQVSYFVNNAGWSPLYDIRVENTTKPVELTMKANVYQNSGEDWENVPLTLSTNNPFRNKVKPELQVWYLNYYYVNRGYIQKADKKTREVEALSAKSYEADEEALSEITMEGNILATPATISSNYTVKKSLMASATYTIPLKYSVKSNNQAHLVAVKTDKIKSNFYHYLVPKFDTDAYIVAKLIDWEDLDLLPSKANIFYNGTYIGETRINPTANDTLNLSLGNDPNVVVKRTRNSDKTKEKVFSNQKEKTIVYDLVVKNKIQQSISVVVEDQIPVTTDKTIKISLERKDGASLNEDNGMLTWDFKLKSYNSKKFRYTYKVKYDKGKKLNGELY